MLISERSGSLPNAVGNVLPVDPDRFNVSLIIFLGQLKNPVLGVCVVLKENSVQDGGQVVAGNCEIEYNFNDGRSVWYGTL